MTSQASAEQAWAILERHARKEISSLRLQELCTDNQRVSSLVAVHTSQYYEPTDQMGDMRQQVLMPHVLIADISRQKITLETLQHLYRLAKAREIRQFIDVVSFGKIGAARFRSIHTPDTAYPMYLALRAPINEDMVMIGPDGSNVLDSVHKEWQRIEAVATGIRTGKVKGVSGEQVRDVIVVGRGVTVMALRFFYDALRRDKLAGAARITGSTLGVSNRALSPRRLRFVSSIDPTEAEAAAADLNPACTMIISIVLSDDSEMSLATKTMKTWLLNGLKKYQKQKVEDKHMIVIAASSDLYMNHLNNIQNKSTGKKENLFILPTFNQCQAFSTFTAAGLLPLSIIFGWKIVEKILAGAHDIDVHFTESNLRHNIPCLLALADVWNEAFLGYSGRILNPFSQPFHGFPEFVAMLESETCGQIGRGKVSAGAVYTGGSFGEYDRMLYQGGRIIPSELVTAFDTQAYIGVANDPVKSQYAQDTTICSFFAHADLLAFGNQNQNKRRGVSKDMNNDIIDGNRPSTLLICGKTDAFTCGQLIALSEHRAVIKAQLFNINPFTSSSTVGSAMRSKNISQLSVKLHRLYQKGLEGQSYNEEDDERVAMGTGSEKANIATGTILSHYVSRMQDQKIYVVK